MKTFFTSTDYLLPLEPAKAADRLGLIRLTVYGLWLASINFSMNFEGFPRLFFKERGILALLPESWLEFLLSTNLQGFPGYALMGIIGAAMLGLRPFPLWAGLSLVIIILHEGMIQGFSSIFCNNRVCIMLAAMVLPFSPAVSSWTPFKRSVRSGEASKDYSCYLWLISILVLLTYTLVGAQRIVRKSCKVFMDTDAVQSWLVVRNAEAVDGVLSLGQIISNSEFLLVMFVIGFFIISVLEMLSPLSLIHRGFAWIWLLGMSSFHILSYYTMGIFFWQNMILIWMLFFPGLASLGLFWPWSKRQA